MPGARSHRHSPVATQFECKGSALPQPIAANGAAIVKPVFESKDDRCLLSMARRRIRRPYVQDITVESNLPVAEDVPSGMNRRQLSTVLRPIPERLKAHMKEPEDQFEHADYARAQ